jgi:hypothetical protein
MVEPKEEGKEWGIEGRNTGAEADSSEWKNK